jgi:hypothetical protein
MVVDYAVVRLLKSRVERVKILLKKVFLRKLLNEAMLSAALTYASSQFHKFGADAENARPPKDVCRVIGISRIMDVLDCQRVQLCQWVH